MREVIVRPEITIENLFEDEVPKKNVRESTGIVTSAGRVVTSSSRSLSLPSFKMPALVLPGLPVFLYLALAVGMIWFGASTSGTFYGPVSGQFRGFLATIFYQYQIGTFAELAGFILAYESVKMFLKR